MIGAAEVVATVGVRGIVSVGMGLSLGSGTAAREGPSVRSRDVGCPRPATDAPGVVDRRGRPILIDGTEALRSDSQGATIDWLFSYRPTPGTLVYVGYGTAMDDVGQQRFRSFERQFDGFFAKLSYRFSV